MILYIPLQAQMQDCETSKTIQNSLFGTQRWKAQF
jgi:hypothetical protein